MWHWLIKIIVVPMWSHLSGRWKLKELFYALEFVCFDFKGTLDTFLIYLDVMGHMWILGVLLEWYVGRLWWKTSNVFVLCLCTQLNVK